MSSSAPTTQLLNPSRAGALPLSWAAVPRLDKPFAKEIFLISSLNLPWADTLAPVCAVLSRTPGSGNELQGWFGCFPQGPEGFLSVGFAPPTGSKAALRSRNILSYPGDNSGLIHTQSLQLGLICVINKSDLGPEQIIELKCWEFTEFHSWLVWRISMLDAIFSTTNKKSLSWWVGVIPAVWGDRAFYSLCDMVAPEWHTESYTDLQFLS